MKYFKPLPKERIIKVESVGNNYKFYYFNGDPKGTYRKLTDLTDLEKQAVSTLLIQVAEEDFKDRVFCEICRALTYEKNNSYYCPICDEERYYLKNRI